ncbi:MAG: hypothetical protein EA393_13790 [Bacteroidetes bacterium]|nr:MAG: hypothetical protein EA393_13790 [Bacteroidota bacterium]
MDKNSKNNKTVQAFEALKTNVQIKARNGIDFIIAAAIIWIVISFIWKFADISSYQKSLFTFLVSMTLLPVAFALSKVLKTDWKSDNNPLSSLGLWLNFAQFAYFPFVLIALFRYPDYFIVAYAIIAGAHLFPYAWLYDEIGYAFASLLISFGSMVFVLFSGTSDMFMIPVFTAFILIGLAFRILFSLKNRACQQ